MDYNELKDFIEKKMHEEYFNKTDEEVLNRYDGNWFNLAVFFFMHYSAFCMLSSLWNFLMGK